MSARYRAEHVGSLLRPAELQQARAAFRGGSLGQEKLREAEDRAIREAFRRQREIGIDICTDGELRRASWLTDMAEAVDGFVPDRVALEWKGPGGGLETSTGKVAGAKLRKLRKLTQHELPFLKAMAPGPFKITLPAPSNFMIASYKPGITDKFYSSHAELLADLVAIIRDEIQWLMSLGVAYIQLDAPYYSFYLDPVQRDRMRKARLDPDREFERAIAGDNSSIEGVPREGVTLALHICRGNSRSRWFTEGGYDQIAEKLFGQLDVDAFLLEYDSSRSGGFEPLRFVPDGKTIVLGLVTTKTPSLESRDELCRRVDEAARYVPLDNLALSPQCGFASVEAGNLLSPEQQWRKLELVAQTARAIWK